MITYLLFPVRLFLLIILSRVNMKKLLILLFSILISFNSYGLFGWFEKTVCVETAGYINGITYLPNETKPFTGNNLCEYESGQYKTKGKVEDGKRDGKWTKWRENGQKWFEEYYKDGKLDGKWTWWYENGKKMLEGNYINDKQDGKWIGWHHNGQIYIEGNYKDGKQEGKVTMWYGNGQKEYEGKYKDGECISGDCPY